MSQIYENLDSSAINSINIEDSVVKVVYKSNIAKEYTFNCEDVDNFTQQLSNIIAELEANHTNVSLGSYINESIRRGVLVAEAPLNTEAV